MFHQVFLYDLGQRRFIIDHPDIGMIALHIRRQERIGLVNQNIPAYYTFIQKRFRDVSQRAPEQNIETAFFRGIFLYGILRIPSGMIITEKENPVLFYRFIARSRLNDLCHGILRSGSFAVIE